VRDLSAAIERALELGVHDADGVRLILQQRSEQPVGQFCLEGRPQLKSVHVAPPDLKGYGKLMNLREVSA
jgi:hypothetical protein